MSYHQTVQTTARTIGGFFLKSYLAALSLLVVATGLTSQSALAADETTGTVEGRVLNLSNGKYISKAVVGVEGTTLQTLTNDYGEYILRNIPAGESKITAAFSGQLPKTTTVVVAAGKTVNQDFGLSQGQEILADGTIVLDEYVVASERFKNAQELAAHEERHSTSIKNVVSTDSLGFVPDGNVAEFVRFLPGIQTMNYTGGSSTSFGSSPSDASQVSVRGFAPTETTIFIDGMEMSSASTEITRATGVDMLSINNASRIEVLKVATPDMAASSSGGSINLVTRSAFEYARPTYTASAYLTLNTMEPNVFKKQPGPTNKATYHTLPGGRMSVAVPVNSKFGFTVSVASDNKFAPYQGRQSDYQMELTTVNLTAMLGTATANRSVIVSNGQGNAGIKNPYLRSAKFSDQPWNTFRQSGNVKADWKPFTGLLLTGNLQYSRFTGATVDRSLAFDTYAPVDWGADFTEGRTVEVPNYGNRYPGVGQAQMTVSGADKVGQTRSAYLKANYTRGPWTVLASVSSSISDSRRSDQDNKHFSSLTSKITTNIGQLSFYGIKDGLPSEIVIKDRTGQTINYSDLRSWTESSGNEVTFVDARARDTKDTYQLDLRRELDFLPFSLAIKTGVYRKFEENRTFGGGTTTYKYTAGTASTADDSIVASQVLDANYQVSPGYGLAPQQWMDVYKLYGIYKANPTFFDQNATQTLIANNAASKIKQNKTVEETNDDYYAMFEAKFLNNRLSVIGGARSGRSKRETFQWQKDSKWNYLKNADGTIYRDSVYRGGVKLDYSNANLTDPATGTTSSVSKFDYTTDAELMSRLRAQGVTLAPMLMSYNTLGDRIQANTGNNMDAVNLYYKEAQRLKASRNNPVQPQLQAAYELTKKINLQVSWTREKSLPALSTNTGLNALSGTYEMNESSNPEDANNPSTVKVTNPNLPPQTTTSYNFRVGYYPTDATSFTVSYYYKAIKNITETLKYYKGTDAFSEMAEIVGLDEAGLVGENWIIETAEAGGKRGLSRGVELDLRQNLGFLGDFGSRFSTFVTYSKKMNKKSPPDNNIVQILADTGDESYSFGVLYGAPRWSAAVRGTYTKQKAAQQTTRIKYRDEAGILISEIASYQTPDDLAQPLRINAEITYSISKHYSFFLSGSNIFNTKAKSEKYDAAGYLPEWAKTYKAKKYGVTLTTGVNATF